MQTLLLLTAVVAASAAQATGEWPQAWPSGTSLEKYDPGQEPARYPSGPASQQSHASAQPRPRYRNAPTSVYSAAPAAPNYSPEPGYSSAPLPRHTVSPSSSRRQSSPVPAYRSSPTRGYEAPSVYGDVELMLQPLQPEINDEPLFRSKVEHVSFVWAQPVAPPRYGPRAELLNKEDDAYYEPSFPTGWGALAPHGEHNAAHESYEAHLDPHGTPEGSRGAPGKPYSAPGQSYSGQGQYSGPEEAFVVPRKNYRASKKSYSATEEFYESPEESYGVASESYEDAASYGVRIKPKAPSKSYYKPAPEDYPSYKTIQDDYPSYNISG